MTPFSPSRRSSDLSARQARRDIHAAAGRGGDARNDIARTMIAEAGLAALWFAAALALLQLVLAAIGVRATRVAVAAGAPGSGTPAFAGEQGAAAGLLDAVRPGAGGQGALAVPGVGRRTPRQSGKRTWR